MNIPILGEAIRLASLAGVSVPVGAVVTLQIRGADPLTLGQLSVQHTALNGDYASSLALLFDDGVAQLLWPVHLCSSWTSTLPGPFGDYPLSKEGSQHRLINGISVRGDQFRDPRQTRKQLLKELLDKDFGAFADDHFQHQSMIGIVGDVIPLVATEEIFFDLGVTVLLLFADEGPLFIQLDLVGIGGKSPPVRRATGGHAFLRAC